MRQLDSSLRIALVIPNVPVMSRDRRLMGSVFLVLTSALAFGVSESLSECNPTQAPPAEPVLLTISTSTEGACQPEDLVIQSNGSLPDTLRILREELQEETGLTFRFAEGIGTSSAHVLASIWADKEVRRACRIRLTSDESLISSPVEGHQELLDSCAAALHNARSSLRPQDRPDPFIAVALLLRAESVTVWCVTPHVLTMESDVQKPARFLPATLPHSPIHTLPPPADPASTRLLDHLAPFLTSKRWCVALDDLARRGVYIFRSRDPYAFARPDDVFQIQTSDGRNRLYAVFGERENDPNGQSFFRAWCYDLSPRPLQAILDPNRPQTLEWVTNGRWNRIMGKTDQPSRSVGVHLVDFQDLISRDEREYLKKYFSAGLPFPLSYSDSSPNPPHGFGVTYSVNDPLAVSKDYLLEVREKFCDKCTELKKSFRMQFLDAEPTVLEMLRHYVELMICKRVPKACKDISTNRPVQPGSQRPSGVSKPTVPTQGSQNKARTRS